MNTIIIKFKSNDLRNHYEEELRKMKVNKFGYLKVWLQVEFKNVCVDFNEKVVQLSFNEFGFIEIKLNDVEVLYN